MHTVQEPHHHVVLHLPVHSRYSVYKDGHGSGSGYKSINPYPNPGNPDPCPLVTQTRGSGSVKLPTRDPYPADPTRKPVGPKTWICPHCKDCPELEKCIVRKKAQERSVADIAKMTGVLLSSTETTDVLGYSLEVGGVQYQAFSKESLHDLRHNHSLAAKYAMKKKRGKKTQVGGTMRLVGSRHATGGGRGDKYRMYAHHSADTEEGVEALMAAARDSDTLLNAVRAWAPEAFKEI
ncbi:hypothetical protein GGX14DRAFT_398173 [Mycena pura]|uniref:Uncharacterized protein n=1 Tax=Mycena pura TaxID=153505 RepID=A0AAD6VB82_9AGAR|nr:hypothetical protein GGX14DRAFT_398173 [Mycena pura]